MSEHTVMMAADDVFAAPLVNCALPRWQRKMRALASSGASNGTASSLSSVANSVFGSSADFDAENEFAPKTPSAAKTPARTPARTPRNRNDRFIPDRSAMDFELSHFQLTDASTPAREIMHAPDALDALDAGAAESASVVAASAAVPASPAVTDSDGVHAEGEFHAKLNENLFGAEAGKSAKILAFKSKAPSARSGFDSSVRVLYAQQGVTAERASREVRAARSIPQQPERILDAPELVDDYYLNLLDWSAGNQLAVALGQSVYVWNAASGSIQQLCTVQGDENYVTSVSWIQEGNYLAVGTNFSDVQLWDCGAGRQVRNMKGHLARVSSLAWNQHVLSSGSRDNTIINHDVRVAQHHIATLQGHDAEVCGLKWSPDGTQLASGGNDNTVNIWQAGETTARFTFRHHTAAVKALAWCPFHANVLATGGGTSDRTIRFWNTAQGSLLNTIDTKSQVCSLLWSTQNRELISSHGFSQNQITVWKYPTMTKVAELNGHTSRVLHMAMSPDGQTIASAAGDETLRFWRIITAADNKAKRTTSTSAVAANAAGMNLRSIR